MQAQKNEYDCCSSGNITASSYGQVYDFNQFISSSTLTLSNENVCRICHESGVNEELYSYCQCKGSVGLTHSSCLLFWIKRSGSVKCELCKERYSTVAQMNKRFWQWKLPRIGTKGWLKLVFFIGFLSMLITFTTWIIWSRTSSSSEAKQERNKRQVEYTYLVYGMLVLISLVGIYALNFRPFLNFMSRCIVMNQNIAVIPKGELCKEKAASLEDWTKLITSKDNHGTESKKGFCKHHLGTEPDLKDTGVQFQEQGTESAKYGLHRYIKLGVDGNCDSDIAMV